MATSGSMKRTCRSVMLTWNWYGAPRLSLGFVSGPTVGSSTTGGAPEGRIWKSKYELDRRRIIALLLVARKSASVKPVRRSMSCRLIVYGLSGLRVRVDGMVKLVWLAGAGCEKITSFWPLARDTFLSKIVTRTASGVKPAGTVKVIVG